MLLMIANITFYSTTVKTDFNNNTYVMETTLISSQSSKILKVEILVCWDCDNESQIS